MTINLSFNIISFLLLFKFETFSSDVTESDVEDVVELNRKIFCSATLKIDAIEKIRGPPPKWIEKYSVIVGDKEWAVSELKHIAYTPPYLSNNIKSFQAVLQVKDELNPQCSKLQWSHFIFWKDVSINN